MPRGWLKSFLQRVVADFRCVRVLAKSGFRARVRPAEKPAGARVAVLQPTAPLAIAGQVILYGAFAAFIGVFSTYPSYRHLEPGQALLKLSFTHAGQLAQDCRRRTPEELAKLAPNMRAPMDCPRARSPVTVELELDGRLLARRVAPPSGLSKDGASALYERFAVPAGEHELSVKFNDSARIAGFNYEREEKVELQPGQVLVVDFNPERGGVLIQ